MDMQEKQIQQEGGLAILAIVAIFVLILGTVMLFADEEVGETSKRPDFAAQDRQKPSDQVRVTPDRETREIRRQSEG